MTSRSDTERLRRALAEAAYDIRPSAVPLEGIVRRGRRIRRRRAAMLTAGCCLLFGIPATLAAHFADARSGHPVRPSSTSTASPAPAPPVRPVPPLPPPPPRVVAPGERVTIAPGAQLWLTREGKHWLLPGSPGEETQPVDADATEPGASVQARGTSDRMLLSGAYWGTRKAAQIKIVTAKGTVDCTLIQLSGTPGWGAYYATAAPADRLADGGQDPGYLRSLTVYDADGAVIDTLPLS